MSNMFYKCPSLELIDLSSFNTNHVTKMNGMFYKCSSLKSIDLSSFNTTNVTNMKINLLIVKKNNQRTYFSYFQH